MRNARARWIFATCLLVVVFACTESTPRSDADPVTIEPMPGSAVNRVTLQVAAARRLGIATSTVKAARPGSAGRTVAPYSAILYGTNGETWVYTTREDLVFVRSSVRVAAIRGDSAFLLAGPPVGTRILTVGAAELYGAELGVD